MSATGASVKRLVGTDRNFNSVKQFDFFFKSRNIQNLCHFNNNNNNNNNNTMLSIAHFLKIAQCAIYWSHNATQIHNTISIHYNAVTLYYTITQYIIAINSLLWMPKNRNRFQ